MKVDVNPNGYSKCDLHVGEGSIYVSVCYVGGACVLIGLASAQSAVYNERFLRAVRRIIESTSLE